MTTIGSLQGSGPGSDPAAALASRWGELAQPALWNATAPCGSRECVRRTIVASPSAVSATSTAVDCSPTSNRRVSQPQVKTIRQGKSTCTYSPIIFDPLMSNRQTPPGRGSSVASLPIQRTSFDGSVKYSNTTSGGASTRTSCSMRSVAAGVSATLALLDDL